MQTQEDGSKKAERDGRQKEEMVGNRMAKEKVAKAGSRRAKAKVYGRLMTSWASGTSSISSSSSRRRKDRNRGSRKRHGEAMKIGGKTALDLCVHYPQPRRMETDMAL